MALRLVSLLIALVLVGLLASTMRTHFQGTQKSGPATPENLLRETGMVVERTHQLTGEYTGVGLQGGSAMRLVSGDGNGYCLELTWVDRQVYHLRGPGGQPAPGGC
jgi:hypothetical protein